MFMIRNGSFKILDKWYVKESVSMLKSVKQVLYKEAVANLNYAWFLLELTDGFDECYVEMQIENEGVMGHNVLNVKTIYEYSNTLMYVDM